MHQNQSEKTAISPEIEYLASILEDRFKIIENHFLKPPEPRIPETAQPSEVCKKMGWSRSKFEEFKRVGLFRTEKIGGKIYVSTADLRKLFPKDFF